MKTVLLITTEEAHRLLYGRALKEQFVVISRSSTRGAPRDVAAVIYDLPRRPALEDFRWLEGVGVPVVVLTPTRRSLRMPNAQVQRVLEYRVRAEQILRALEDLGVRACDEC